MWSYSTDSSLESRTNIQSRAACIFKKAYSEGIIQFISGMKRKPVISQIRMSPGLNTHCPVRFFYKAENIFPALIFIKSFYKLC